MVEDLHDTLRSIVSEVSSLNAKLDSVSQALADSKEDRAEIHKEIAKVYSRQADTNTRVALLEAQISEMKLTAQNERSITQPLINKARVWLAVLATAGGLLLAVVTAVLSRLLAKWWNL